MSRPAHENPVFIYETKMRRNIRRIYMPLIIYLSPLFIIFKLCVVLLTLLLFNFISQLSEIGSKYPESNSVRVSNF